MNSNLIEILFSQYGIAEIPGQQDNPEIIKYFTDLGFEENRFKDETAWCSAFANWAAAKAGLQTSGMLNARSWLTVGKKVDYPQPGDVVIFWRESMDSWKGHVAFFINDDQKNIYVLGGNQSNQVCISAYPGHRVLQIRRL